MRTGEQVHAGHRVRRQVQREAAARAFALECLNDPRFAFSPWWREPGLFAQRVPAMHAFAVLRARPDVGALSGALSLDAEQIGSFQTGEERHSRRTRTGYPVLMRNLDLAAPTDLYDVREPATPPATATALPAKGWLPAPLLRRLLEETVPATP